MAETMAPPKRFVFTVEGQTYQAVSAKEGITVEEQIELEEAQKILNVNAIQMVKELRNINKNLWPDEVKAIQESAKKLGY